jgi:hypothetical protein
MLPFFDMCVIFSMVILLCCIVFQDMLNSRALARMNRAIARMEQTLVELECTYNTQIHSYQRTIRF